MSPLSITQGELKKIEVRLAKDGRIADCTPKKEFANSRSIVNV